MLARFSESFGDYAFLMNVLYGKTAPEIALKNKQEFLKDYLSISTERGSAFNYYKQPEENLWDTNNISGFQKRASTIARNIELQQKVSEQFFCRNLRSD